MPPAVPHHRPTILVVDDDVDARVALRVALEEEGFAVDSAGDGLTALQKIREQAPDLVILDLHMPRMGGEDFLYAWRAGVETPGVPVIVITAISRGIRPQDLRVDAFLTKPFDLDALVRHVRRLVESPSPSPVTGQGGTRTDELRHVAESVVQVMGVILGTVELLEDGPSDPDERHAVTAKAVAAAQRGSALARRLHRVIATLD